MTASQCISEKDLYSFFNHQLDVWPELAQQVENLGRALLKRLFQDHLEIDIQYNPARLTSATADIRDHKIQQRPCFLCPENQSPKQRRIPLLGKYWLETNPYPILQYHFTISSQEHTPQDITGRMVDLCHLATTFPSFVLFYNGAQCGASAPDHMHFQMGEKGQIPLQYNWHIIKNTLRPLFTFGEEGIFLQEKYIYPYFVIRSKEPETGQCLFNRLISVLPIKENHTESDLNIIAWKEGDWVEVCVIPRSKHRPSSYEAQDDNGFCISPGCIDMGGLIITPRSSDFHKINAQQAIDILQEVTYKEQDIRNCANTLILLFKNHLEV